MIADTSQPNMALSPLPPLRTRHPASLDPTFEHVREHGRFYIEHSFVVRPGRLGSIESHPDFE
jgi:hypothetical protein